MKGLNPFLARHRAAPAEHPMNLEKHMQRRNLITSSVGAALALTLTQHASAATPMDDATKMSFDTVMAFMGAMGKGDMKAMSALMADDMVWHNEGDQSLPWIGNWEGKTKVFEFLPLFGANFKTTAWENTDAFASGDTVAVFGKMNGITLKSGKEIGPFTFALRAKVRNGQVVLWHWFEDTYAVSKAYHGK
jgi:ketosteroid isomerase-like protein